MRYEKLSKRFSKQNALFNGLLSSQLKKAEGGYPAMSLRTLDEEKPVKGTDMIDAMIKRLLRKIGDYEYDGVSYEKVIEHFNITLNDYLQRWATQDCNPERDIESLFAEMGNHWSRVKNTSMNKLSDSDRVKFFNTLQKIHLAEFLTLYYMVKAQDFINLGPTHVFGKFLAELNEEGVMTVKLLSFGKIETTLALHGILFGQAAVDHFQNKLKRVREQMGSIDRL